jgi:hypothetical protein
VKRSKGEKVKILPIIFLAVAALTPSVVTIEMPKSISAKAGENTQLRLKLKIKEGFHVQANPASEKYLIPTKIDFKETEQIKPGKIVYPKPKPFQLEGSDKSINTYEGLLEIAIPLQVSSKAAPGEYALSGTLRYQACDAKTCLRPATQELQLKVQVLK